MGVGSAGFCISQSNRFNTKYKLILVNPEEKKIMKKLAIAASSLALAAMPVVGVFAAQASNPAALSDTLTINVDGVCTFERTDGTGSYTKTMTANSAQTLGTSTYTTHCNNHAGYTIAVTTPNLAGPTNIPFQSTAPVAGTAGWAIQTNTTGEATYYVSGNFAETNTQDPAAGNVYTATYLAATATDQSQGTYTGTVTYTLTQKNS